MVHLRWSREKSSHFEKRKTFKNNNRKSLFLTEPELWSGIPLEYKPGLQIFNLDPIVNDHYADILWKLNKNLQANYFWNYVLNLETTEDEMKHRIKEKLIFGIENRS